MTKRPTSGYRFSSDGANLRPIRLALEPLEARRLLAGMDLSGAQSAATFLTLDYCAGSATVQQTSASFPLKSQFQELSAEGEAGNNSYELREDAPPGTLLGPIAFDAPLGGQQYTLQSSDPRFSIEGNQLYFTGGELNFESEPMIGFVITAVNDASEVIATTGAVVTIAHATEQPLAIELSDGQVYEHQPGAIIGDLFVVGPDASAQNTYAFYLFDSRFTVSGNQLRLADGAELDFATEPEVLLAVAATDGGHEIFDTVRIEVMQQPETPEAASSIALDPRRLVELTAGAPVGQASVVDPKDASYEFTVSDERFEFVGNQLKLRDDRQVDAKLEPDISLTLTAVGDQGDEASDTFSVTVISTRSPYHNYNLNEDVNGDGFVSPIDALLVINALNTHGAGPLTTVGDGSSGEPLPMLDVNGDGMITPIDVLLIINHLNRTRSIEFRSVHDRLAEQSTIIDPPTIIELPTDLPDDSIGGDLETTSLDHTPDEQTLAAGQFSSGSPAPLTGASPETGAANFFGQFSEGSADRRKRENASIDAELELLLDQLSHSRPAVL